MSRKSNAGGATPEQMSTKIEAMPTSSESTTNQILSDKMLKNLFFGGLLFMLLLTWLTGFKSGYHQDEIDMCDYGKANIAYYMTGGKDTSFMGSTKKNHELDEFIRYYGSAFEYIATGVNILTGQNDGKQQYKVRHIVNQLFGIVALLFTGLIARRFSGGWGAAILASWLAFLSPSFSGHFLFNTKDVPFCAGYVATVYYIICFLEQLPVVSWKTTLKLMAAFAFTTDIRIGGVLLLMYLFVFTGVYVIAQRKSIGEFVQSSKNLAVRYGVVVIGGLALVVLSWPFLLRSPVKNIIETLGVIKKYPVKIYVNFEGETLESLNLPASYIPKLLSLTIPVFLIIFLFIGLLLCCYNYRKLNLKIGALVLFATIFPLFYAISTNANLYCGWRHFLFIYPGFCIFAAMGVVQLLDFFNNRMVKIALLSVSGLSMVHPILWSVKNHPYEYCYFNEISGGFKNIFYNYDTDYWQMTMEPAIDWMMKNEPIAQSKDTVYIATNIPRILKNYLSTQYPEATKVKVVDVGCSSRNLINWHYAVFNSFLIKPDYLENYFPPKTMIHSENIDGLPVTAILKDTSRLDMLAMDALSQNHSQLADSLFTAFIAKTGDQNPAVDAYYAIAKAQKNDNDAAIVLANGALQYHLATLNDYWCYCGMGLAYTNKRQFQQGIEILQTAIDLMPGEQYARILLDQAQAQMNAQKQ